MFFTFQIEETNKLHATGDYVLDVRSDHVAHVKLKEMPASRQIAEITRFRTNESYEYWGFI